MFAIHSVAIGQIKRRLRHTHGPRGCLNAGAFEGFHQLLKPFAGFPAQKVFPLHLKAIKGQLIFLHTAIAQDLNLTTGHAVTWEGNLFATGCFLGQEHREAFVIFCVWIRARQ